MPGTYVLLVASDKGVDIGDEAREHVFEPFDSTRGEAGTGFGLATLEVLED